MTRLAVFDCDGTLVDSQAVICDAMGLCFAEAGLPEPDRAAVRRIVGLSLPQAMAVLAPDTIDHHALADRYKHAFHGLRTRGLVHEPLFPGVRELIERLDGEGWLLGVATGKSDRGLRLVLEAHGLRRHFVTLQTADRHPSKPDPAMLRAAMAEVGVDPADTAMIGDTSYDIMMAKAAGARAIGVAWGYHPPEELFAAGADSVAIDPDDIPALILEAA